MSTIYVILSTGFYTPVRGQAPGRIVFASRFPPRPFGTQCRSVLCDCSAVYTGVQVLVQACRDTGRVWVRTAVKVIGGGFVCSVVAGGAHKIAVP